MYKVKIKRVPVSDAPFPQFHFLEVIYRFYVFCFVYFISGVCVNKF